MRCARCWSTRGGRSDRGVGAEGISLYSEFRPHVVLLDVKMAGLDGLETLSRLETWTPRTVVMISGHGTIATAVAGDPARAPSISWKSRWTPIACWSRCGTRSPRPSSRERTRGSGKSARNPVSRWWETSRGLEEVRAIIDKVGPTHARVLITGENGSGKELVARAIHEALPPARPSRSSR